MKRFIYFKYLYLDDLDNLDYLDHLDYPEGLNLFYKH